jgi:hypothetical protein
MGNTLTSPKGGPLYNNTPQTVADLQAAITFIEKMGNHRADTTTARNAASGIDVFDGLLWDDTTDGFTYRYISPTGWVKIAGPLVTASPTVRSGNGWSVGAGTRLSKDAFGRVLYEAEFTRASATPGPADTIADLPTGFKPVARRSGIGAAFASGNAIGYDLNTDGSIVVNNFASVGSVTAVRFAVLYTAA